MSSEPKTDRERETKQHLRQSLAEGKVRLAMDGAPLAAIAGAVIAVIHLLLSPRSGNLFSAPLALPLEVLVLFQLTLGVAWTLWKGSNEGMRGWGLALVLSAIGSGAIWAMVASLVLQTPGAGAIALVPPLLALFLFGLHFASLGLHLLLFVISLCGGLLLTGVGAAHPSAGQQALLILFAAMGSVSVLGLFLMGNRLPRLDAELELLRQERDGLREDSDSNLQRFQGADADRQALEDALANAKQAAQAADVKKNEFLAIMSHEIRTPLNGILPLLEMLGATPLNKEQRQLLNTANNSSRHLLRIINDILDFSKIEAGKLELEQVELSLKELIESVTGLMGNMAERRNIRLDYRISPQLPDRLRGDPLRLRQILTNLVSNAVKFTEKGQISVEATPHRTGRRDVEVLFLVRDTGVGMGHDTVRRLFSSFTQADASTTRKYGGTGLGLAICKRLVNIMGGQIGVRSRTGKGSIFWFLIPMRRSLDEVPAGRESLADVRVLLAGFNERDYKEISGHLSGWGGAFSQAEDVPKTLAALNAAARLGESWLPDLVIFDQSRLGNAAKTLLTELRGSPRLLHTAAVALVGDPADAAAWLELGANDILTRPLRPAQLQQCLHRLLDVRGVERRESQILADADSITPLLEQDILDPGDQDSHPLVTPPEPPRDRLAGSVLLVEDNDVNRAVARRLLERIGIEVDEAIDGVQALARVEQRGYDLVLMDCRMPNKDGYEATGEIRIWERKQRLGRMPIIAMTANAMAGDREKCIDAGMDDYLMKPVNRDTLFDMMSKWIKPREKRPTIAPYPIHPTAEVNDMSDVPIEQSIDMKIINELKEVMEGEFGVLLESYISNIPPLYAQLRNAAVAGDIGGMVNPAHSIKSSSANVGAMKVSDAAKTIEMAARMNDGETAKKAFQLLNQVLPPAIKALTELAKGS
ncbi:MAG: response regulator [Gammaproteobacteria bacterium]|nr:response regulator [Gammaproteobacteria bacterium]MBU1654650.1 response regulator [Gammaproteobacteria bacterium]MBU1960443.1 response regulator [Gammaproteobacteria bacterium]